MIELELTGNGATGRINWQNLLAEVGPEGVLRGSDDLEKAVSARSGCFFHRLFDRVNIRVCCAVEPRCVHAQRYLNAMAMLLRDPEQILAQHEMPGTTVDDGIGLEGMYCCSATSREALVHGARVNCTNVGHGRRRNFPKNDPIMGVSFDIGSPH